MAVPMIERAVSNDPIKAGRMRSVLYPISRVPVVTSINTTWSTALRTLLMVNT